MKEKIIELSQQNKSFRQIADELGCSLSTVKYHLIPNRKEKEIARTLANRIINPIPHKLDAFNRKKLKNRIEKFNKRGKSNNVTPKMIKTKFGEKTKCYLTGESINFSKPETYSLDHIIPLSRGGLSTLENLGICTYEINMAKHDKTPEEFIELCKKVLEYNGYTINKN